MVMKMGQSYEVRNFWVKPVRNGHLIAEMIRANAKEKNRLLFGAGWLITGG